MTSPIIATFSGNSETLLTVTAFSDGTITVPGFSVNRDKPILYACRRILDLAGFKAQPYKLAIYRNGTKMTTVRSVIWGSRRTVDEVMTDLDLYDHIRT